MQARPDFDMNVLPPRELRVVLVCDLVESVQWMEQDEDNAISRWQVFSQRIRDVISPIYGGSVVKSTGDGVMVEFPTARSAVEAAAALHASADENNHQHRESRRLQLRVGVHETFARRDSHDLYGHGVNLAARIATLARPGETVLTAQVRDQLTDLIDGEIEDLGECYLKHVTEPQRAYRISSLTNEPAPQVSHTALQSSIAVIPFTSRSPSPEHFAVGELIVDGVLAQLSRTPTLRVISRLSSSPFRDRDTSLGTLKKHLNANFVVNGSYLILGEKMLVSVELMDVQSGEVCWANRFNCAVADLLLLESECCHTIAEGVHRAVLDMETQKALVRPIPTLSGYTLLLGGISLMHRSSAREFQRSREVLDALVERHGRSATIRAWIGKWHVLRVVRGISPNPEIDARLAIDATKRAQDLEPSSAHALAIHGHALCQLSDDPGAALQRLDESIALNPNESLAWLYKSVWSSMWGELGDAVIQAERAKQLSPLDPLSYYYDMMLSCAYAFAGKYDEAIKAGNSSLRQNRHHAPTLRALLIAQYEGGYLEDARQSLQQLLLESPGLTVSNYLDMGGKKSHTRQRVARAFRALGLSES